MEKRKEVLQKDLWCPLRAASPGSVLSKCMVEKCTFWDLEKTGGCLIIKMVRNLGDLKKR